MKSSTPLWIGLGVLVVVGGALAMAGSAGAAASPSPAPGTKVGTVGGLAGGGAPGGSTSSDSMGLLVDKDCGIVVTDLGVAQASAFALGKKHGLKEAQARLYRRGACGVTKPLKPARDQLRNSYMVTYHLLRGQVESGQLTRAFAEIALADAYFQVVIGKADIDGLPRTFP
jgi:hypothetical protein